METITLESAQEAGFEPRSYAPCRHPKQMWRYVDFMAKMGEATISVVFGNPMFRVHEIPLIRQRPPLPCSLC